ncbi:hypothetical protein ACAW74_00490 [Fibrella sp. WM1]|uniref:hypothetical protein n=1 Tax=Fibrella musci TaxID=3242485 RepID=UPI003520CBCB
MKLLRYTVLIVASLLWLGGCSRTVMHELYQVGFIPDDYRFGDLYRLSSLPQFKEPVTPCSPPATYPDTSRTDLYLIGDSFTEPGRLAKADLPIHALYYFHWDRDRDRAVQLDTTRRNVLVIESVERHFRQHVEPTPTYNINVVSDTTGTNGPQDESTQWGHTLVDWIKSKGIEERLETLMFSRDLFLWFREVKASINLALFDRYSDQVELSTDRQAIFTNLDINHPLSSAFTPLRDTYLDSLVLKLNVAADHYRKAGFDEVVLSIIPNKVTMLEQDRGAYNHLIERIQQHPNLRLTVLDTYAPYRRSRVPLYSKGDTHWNCAGRTIWLDALRQWL